MLEGQLVQADGVGDRAEKYEACRMYKNGIKFHIICLSAILLAMPTVAICQKDTLSGLAATSSISEKSDIDIHALYTGAGGGSNLIYLGTSISNNKPFYSGSVTYGLRNTLFVSASATHLSETIPYLAFYNLALNYSHAFNSWFDISAQIAGYKTAYSLKDSLFADFALMNLTTGFDWKLIYTRISLSQVFPKENGFYLQISNSRYFETPAFFKGKALISFDPDIDILFGNLIRVETVDGTKKIGKTHAFGQVNRKPSLSTETNSVSFGLMDFEFSLPVTFSYGKLSIEAEPAYLLPAYSDPYYPETEGFTFYMNLIFKIF